MSYLGIYSLSSLIFRYSLDKQNMAISGVCYVGRTALEEMILQHVTRKCLQILLLSAKACNLQEHDNNSLDFVVNRF